MNSLSLCVVVMGCIVGYNFVYISGAPAEAAGQAAITAAPAATRVAPAATTVAPAGTTAASAAAPAAATSVEGSYELTSDPGNPDFAEYLQALGVSEPFRQVMARIKINIEVKKTDVGYKYKVVTPILTRETAFKFGEELDDTYVDGRKYKTTFSFDGEDVKQELKFDNVTGTNVYKFTPGGLTAILKANDKTATRTYKRTE